MNLAIEIRQVANMIGVERPDAATRLLHIAVRVERLELLADDIAADAQQVERLRTAATLASPWVYITTTKSLQPEPPSEVIEFPLPRPRLHLVREP